LHLYKIIPLEVRAHQMLEGHRGAIYSLLHNTAADTLISGGSDGWIVEWDLSGVSKDGKLLAKSDATIFSMTLLSDISFLVAGDIKGQIFHIDLEHKKILKKIKLHNGSIFAIACRGDEILTCGGDGYLVISDKHTGRPKTSIQISAKSLRTLVIVDDNAIIGASDGHVYSICLKTYLHKVLISDAHLSSVFSLCIDRDNNLYSGGRDARLIKWKISEVPAMIKDINAHWFTINNILYLSELDIVVTSSRDKNIRFWCGRELTLLKSIDVLKGGHINSVNICLWIPKTNMLVSASDDRTIKLWNVSR
jgi:WD40 repeat protein